MMIGMVRSEEPWITFSTHNPSTLMVKSHILLNFRGQVRRWSLTAILSLVKVEAGLCAFRVLSCGVVFLPQGTRTDRSKACASTVAGMENKS